MESEQEFSAELQIKTFNILVSNDSADMEILFKNLFSTEPNSKAQSEAVTFFQCSKKHHPDLFFMKLFYIIGTAVFPLTRSHSARALHLLGPMEVWPNLKPMSKAFLKAQFLILLNRETSVIVLEPFSLVVAEIVSAIYNNQNEHWPEILDFLVSSVSSNYDVYRKIALLIFGSLRNECRLRVSDSLRSAGNVLLASLLKCLNSSNNEVKAATFGAVVSLVRLFSVPYVFHELLRAMMVAMFSLLHGSDVRVNFPLSLAEMVKLVVEEPALIKPYANDMVMDMLQIADSDAGLSRETQCTAFELVVVMAERNEYVAVLQDLPRETLTRALLIPVKMMVCIEEDEEEKEKQGLTVYQLGEKWLDRLFVRIGGTKVVSIGCERMQLYMDAADWKKRNAGIVMLTVLAKYFSDQMILMENDFLGKVVTKLLRLFHDPNVRVRLAAFRFMEMPTEFVEVMHILHHHKLIHAFVTALDNDHSYKVKEQAASAMLLCLNKTLPDSLRLYKDADALMQKLIAVVQGKYGAKQRSSALLTFNKVAQQCQEVAHKFCASYLPILLEACQDKNSEIKEEAARGIRICAEFGAPQIKPFVNTILSELSVLLKEPNRSLPENAKAYDIVVSVIGRICEFHRDCIDGSKIVPAWLRCLPLKEDLIEAKLMHEQLYLMVARLDKDLFGAGNPYLPDIFKVLVEVIEKGDKSATSQTINQMSSLLRRVGRHLPPSALQKIALSLNEQQRELFLALIS